MDAERSIHVTVCACTYRRPQGLKALLDGLAIQTASELAGVRVDIIVVDNEGSPEAKSICDDFARSAAIPLRYFHEPHRGISHARNRCLENLAPDCDFFAMIDDDEVPDADWLEQLIRAQIKTDADVVPGKVLSVLPEGTPHWIEEGQYFDWPKDQKTKLAIIDEDTAEADMAMTCNVLVRCSAVRELRLQFDPALALSAGEDAKFFAQLREAGYRIVYAAKARVYNQVPPERATLKYLLRAKFKSGHNRRFKRAHPKKGGTLLPYAAVHLWRTSGCANISSGLGRLTGSVLRLDRDMNRAADGLLKIAYGFGQLASAVGIRYEHYR